MKTWVLIADASRARLFQIVRDGRLSLIQEFQFPAGRKRDQELVTDKPGSLKKGLGRSLHSRMPPPTSPHEMAAQNSARDLVRVLHDGWQRGTYEALALVAPAHFLGLLRERLDPAISRALVATLSRDYTALPDHELTGRLAEHFLPRA